ncbi:MAG: hypothetical protein IJ272_04865 [Clostridia bacterium]|nr:hypothetical protein [Clostridia bacterium]
MENELNLDSVVKENLTNAQDGGNYKTKYYNLDLIGLSYKICALFVQEVL